MTPNPRAGEAFPVPEAIPDGRLFYPVLVDTGLKGFPYYTSLAKPVCVWRGGCAYDITS